MQVVIPSINRYWKPTLLVRDFLGYKIQRFRGYAVRRDRGRYYKHPRRVAKNTQRPLVLGEWNRKLTQW